MAQGGRQPTEEKESRRACPSAGSEAGGTDGAGLASQIDVQARGEVLGVAHIKRVAAKSGHVNVCFDSVSHAEFPDIRVKYGVHNCPDGTVMQAG
jgi:hypothetical protein